MLVLVPHESDVVAWVEAAGSLRRHPDGGALRFPPRRSRRSTRPSRRCRCWCRRRWRSTVCTRARRARSSRRRARSSGGCRRARDFAAATIVLRAGRRTSISAALAERLLPHGYRREDLVLDVGSFAVRGGVFDVFPPAADAAAASRLLRRHGRVDPRLRSAEPALRGGGRGGAAACRSISSRPAKTRRSAVGDGACAALGASDAERLAGARPRRGLPGLAELPAADRRRDDHARRRCSSDALGVAVDPAGLLVGGAHSRRAAARRRRVRGASTGGCGSIPRPSSCRLGDVEAALGRADLVGRFGRGCAGAVDFHASWTDVLHGQLPRFPREVETARARGERLVLVAPPENLPRLRSFLERSERPNRLPAASSSSTASSRAGFRLPPAGMVVFGEAQIFPPASSLPRRTGRARLRAFVGGLRDLKVGDYVVHADHGIGRFVGSAPVAGGDGARRRRPAAGPPAARAGRGRRERGDGDRLRRGQAAAPAARAARPAAAVTAASKASRRGSTSSAARRGTRPRSGSRRACATWRRSCSSSTPSARWRGRRPCRPTTTDAPVRSRLRLRGDARPARGDRRRSRRTCERERPDGPAAVRRRRLRQDRSRDARRLQGGRQPAIQVAVLCPTTILADQHWETFRRRFAGFPVEIEMVSRFRTPAELKARGRQARTPGEVDILIGTHRLLSQDIDAAAPRPPGDRRGAALRSGAEGEAQAVEEAGPRPGDVGHAGAPHPAVLARRRARPLGDRDPAQGPHGGRDRGAAVFGRRGARRDRVRARPRRTDLLRRTTASSRSSSLRTGCAELVPGLRITVGHGQLDERELARRMHAFTAGEYDLLLATTIIENGIDIPNVNTMIVHRADRFGLAQLYQLRGRVGRSTSSRYCYLRCPAIASSPRSRARAPPGIARVLRPRRGLPHRRARPRDPRRRQPPGRRAERPHRDRRHRDVSQAARGDDPRAARRGGRTRRRRRRSTSALRCRFRSTTSRDANLRMETYQRIAAGERRTPPSCSPSCATASGRRRRRCVPWSRWPRSSGWPRRCACSRSPSAAAA